MRTYDLQVQELNAQLDGSRNGAGNGFDSPAQPDMLATQEDDDAAAPQPVTPDGQGVPRLAPGMYSPDVEQCVRQVGDGLCRVASRTSSVSVFSLMLRLMMAPN